MWLLRWSTSKIWRQSMTPSAIFSAWDSSSIFYFWVSVPSPGRLTMKCLRKIGPATSHSKEKNTENWILSLWTCWWECSKSRPMTESLPLKH
jgi:hypothetical protein